MHNHDEHEHHHHSDDKTTIIPTGHLAICPVTGDDIDTREAEKLGRFRNRRGQRIYLCCTTCEKMFDANPEKYMQETHISHELVLTEKEHLTGNAWSFRFTADQPLSWVPGQFIRVEVPHDNPDEEGTKRWFTISSTPRDEIIQITTRITDTTFKQSLTTLAVGEKIQLIEIPSGDFVWQEGNKPLVLVAGGIGITPFYSMLKARDQSGQPMKATLIYNGRSDDLPFRAVFDEANKRHSEFHVHYVIGEQLTAEKLADLVPDINISQVYISGPEMMVESLGKQLNNNGLSSDNLSQDFFPNYSDSDY